MKDGEKDGKMVVLKVGKRGRMRKSKKNRTDRKLREEMGKTERVLLWMLPRRDNQSLFELDDCDRKR